MRANWLKGPRRFGRVRRSREGIVSHRSDNWRRMSSDLQQKRVGADSRDERRNARADVDSPGRRQGAFDQKAHRPAGCRPQQGWSVANAHEGFKQAWFPKELICKRPRTALFWAARAEAVREELRRDSFDSVPHIAVNR